MFVRTCGPSYSNDRKFSDRQPRHTVDPDQTVPEGAS